MTAVIETDNLRRDFTFNLKLTDPGRKVEVKKGDWIGCFLPYPRHYVDPFEIVDGCTLFDPEQIEEERRQGTEFGRLRTTEDIDNPHQNGRLYFNGVDASGCPFSDHQKRLDKRTHSNEIPKP